MLLSVRLSLLNLSFASLCILFSGAELLDEVGHLLLGQQLVLPCGLCERLFGSNPALLRISYLCCTGCALVETISVLSDLADRLAELGPSSLLSMGLALGLLVGAFGVVELCAKALP